MTNSTSMHESSNAEKGSYAPVNGLNMYYEIHGSGEPLVMLHGAFGTVDMYGALLPALAQTRQVIAVELRAHGHTGDIDRPLSYELLADDIAALIKHLELGHADLFGYSLGGGVALQTAIRHPEVVRKLVVVSAPCKRDGWYPEVLAGQAAISAELFAGSPIHEAYVRTAHRPGDWPVLIAKVKQMLEEDYDWTEDVAAIQAPTLLVIGDADGVRHAHVIEMFALLGGGRADSLPDSQLAMLPGTTHLNILARTDLLLPMIKTFLDEPMKKQEAMRDV
jgi:pimeloyl-ACP methyl ester carboxylesterase